MMIGNPKEIAINCEITESVDGWVFGQFYLLIDNTIVGNPDDRSVDIKGCLNWAKDFVYRSVDRYESGLFGLEKEQVFLRLASSVFVNEDKYRFAKEVYQNTFSRFHISHIGMSSFDNVTFLFINDEKQNERLVWKDGNDAVREKYLPPNFLESLMEEFTLKLSELI